MSARLVWIDGALRDAGEAVVGVADRGFLLGHGAFETMRCSGGVIRRWDAHRARLEGGLAYLGVARPEGLDAIPAAAAELAARLALEDAVARLTVSAGEGGAGLDLNAGIQPRLLLTLKTRPEPPQSVAVRIVPGARRAGAPGERFKLSGYGDLIAARREARDGGADRAVVTGPGGVLACADCANLFWIEAGEIFTPALEAGALPGVARAALLAAARGEGLDIAEVLAGPDRLEAAEAAFMTNAAEGVTAISAVNGAAMDPHHPLVRRLRALEAAAP